MENRAASGHEAPKALQKFSMETGFQVSGNIILLLFPVVSVAHLVYTLNCLAFLQGNADLFICGDFIIMSGQCKFLSSSP